MDTKDKKKVMKKELVIDKKVSSEQLKKFKEKTKGIMKKELIIDRKISKEQLKYGENKIKKTNEVYAEEIKKLKEEISKVVVGHTQVINGVVRGLIANGHILIEGVPGIAKTLLIKTIAQTSGCDFSRIQFTVDLLPTDITGVTTYNEKSGEFSTLKGPVFANFVIADEINRAPPKSQSAMLEAMQEKQVTIGKTTHKLPSPFFVMANNNPLESSGTYPLPEAQVDRFLFKLLMNYTSAEDEVQIIDNNVTTRDFDTYDIKPILSPAKILKMQKAVKEVIATEKIKKYIVNIVQATRNPKAYGIKLGKYIEWGCSPRASIGLTIAARADAVINGKNYITPQNVKNIAKDVLRHRLILNYLGQAENIKPDTIVEEILKKVPLP